MYKCENCGAVFDEPEHLFEDRGEGMYESRCGCPACGEAFDEAYFCDSCGGYCLSDELCCGLCADCAEAQYDEERALEFLAPRELELYDFVSNHTERISVCYYVSFMEFFWDSEMKSGMAEILYSDFKQQLSLKKLMGISTSHESEALREFCLYDIFSWTQFAAKCIKKSASALRGEK
ncbi:MAG: hypothetical protein RSE43_08860 [Oscillospiraceae bacterium]